MTSARRTTRHYIRQLASVRSHRVGAIHAARQRGITTQDEADITINGTKINDAESMTVRVAIDTLANPLAEGLGLENDRTAHIDRYMASLRRIQTLSKIRESRKQ
jgi:hypothetical protein